MMLTPMEELGARARLAAQRLALVSRSVKDHALLAAADALVESASAILAANAQDIEMAWSQSVGETVIDRLRLDERRIVQMAEGLRAVAALEDPVGEIADGSVRPNGLRVRRVRVPFGVVGIIYENRPNVTSDAMGLCLKSGNAVMLRGSAGALSSNRAVIVALRAGIEAAGLPADAAILIEDVRHETVSEFVRLRDYVDLLIPRGGPSLIKMVREQASVPYIIDGDGNCHIYVDASADLDMAERIIVNAKMQRPSVCNAVESLLVHKAVADQLLHQIDRALAGVVLAGDDATCARIPRAEHATDEDYATEFLDLRLAIAVVDSIDDAIAHIRRYSSGHSEAIITNDLSHAQRFVNEVDAAAVLVNASTRFIDGGELGLGAEIGISTQKLHARGPMGLKELTTLKFVVEGDGQVRA
jgi:glutamate-5-semialdehyde dehydrogenase